jgi:hypothetical protein
MRELLMRGLEKSWQPNQLGGYILDLIAICGVDRLTSGRSCTHAEMALLVDSGGEIVCLDIIC